MKLMPQPKLIAKKPCESLTTVNADVRYDWAIVVEYAQRYLYEALSNEEALIAASAREKDDPHYLGAMSVAFNDVMSQMQYWRYADKSDRMEALNESQRLVSTAYEPGDDTGTTPG